MTVPCPERTRLEALVTSVTCEIEEAVRERDAAIAAKVANLNPYVGRLLRARIAHRDAVYTLERHKNSHPCVYY